MSAIRTFPIVFPTRSTPTTVSLANLYTEWCLVLPREPDPDSEDVLESSPIVTVLSTISHDDPFPSPNPTNGKLRFCMKTYTENEGILPQLLNLGVVRLVAGVQLSNGPLVEVALDEREISHACLNCVDQLGAIRANFELLGEPRLMRCAGCKKVFYCDVKCQKENWGKHKKTCKFWKTNPSEAIRLIEHERRAGLQSYLNTAGFQTLSL